MTHLNSIMWLVMNVSGFVMIAIFCLSLPMMPISLFFESRRLNEIFLVITKWTLLIFSVCASLFLLSVVFCTVQDYLTHRGYSHLEVVIR